MLILGGCAGSSVLKLAGPSRCREDITTDWISKIADDHT